MTEPRATAVERAEPTRVLVVDDEAMIHEAIALVLDGCVVHRALDAADALRQLDDLPALDVALVDKNLPDRSGLSVVRDIKERRPEIEIIIITGFPSLDSAIEAVEVGAFDYVTKPFHASDLEIKVRNAADKRRMVQREQRMTQQLFRSQRLEALGKLAGSVAHDFNNLLTVYVAYAGILEQLLEDLPRQEGRDEALACIKEMDQATDAATRLTRQLLSFSKQQFLAPEVLSLNDAVEQVGDLLRRLVEPKARLEVELDPLIPPVLIDRGQLQQILMNLATNARDATSGNGSVTVATRAGRDADGACAELSVRDTGQGMPEDVIEHVFDPFYTTKGSKGTGLGLATVHSIVEQAGGHIDLQSTEGVGTQFTIRWPACTSTVDAAPGAQRDTVGAGGERILVVEDEDSVRAVTCRVLSKAGYRVSGVGAADAALKVISASTERIDLILVDVVLPGMSGPEMAEELVGLKSITKIMHMSAYGSETVVDHGLLVDGIPFLAKPFTDERLLRAVRQALDAGDSGTGAES